MSNIDFGVAAKKYLPLIIVGLIVVIGGMYLYNLIEKKRSSNKAAGLPSQTTSPSTATASSGTSSYHGSTKRHSVAY